MEGRLERVCAWMDGRRRLNADESASEGVARPQVCRGQSDITSGKIRLVTGRWSKCLKSMDPSGLDSFDSSIGYVASGIPAIGLRLEECSGCEGSCRNVSSLRLLASLKRLKLASSSLRQDNGPSP
jgi:hypothetical protein